MNHFPPCRGPRGYLVSGPGVGPGPEPDRHRADRFARDPGRPVAQLCLLLERPSPGGQRLCREEVLHRGHGEPLQRLGTATGTVLDGGHPYRTRIVVRRPADKANFNGTVLVESFNVSNDFDAENMSFFAWSNLALGLCRGRRLGAAGRSRRAQGLERRPHGSLDVTRSATINKRCPILRRLHAGRKDGSRYRGRDVLGGLKPRTFIATANRDRRSGSPPSSTPIIPLGNVYDGVLLLSIFGQPVHDDPVVPVSKLLFEWTSRPRGVHSPGRFPRVHRWEIAGAALWTTIYG